MPLPPACKDLIERMLDKEPITRIPMKHVMNHPFVSSLSSKFDKMPETAPVIPKNNKTAVPLNLSHALNKIMSKGIVNLTVKKKKQKPELEP